MTAQTFQCPNCGGKIPLTGGPEKSVKCPFCSSTVIIPKELRATGVMPQAVMPQVIISTTPGPEISSDAVKKGALAVGGITLASIVLPLIITCVIMVVVAGIIGYTTLSATSSIQNTLDEVSSTSGGGITIPGGGVELPSIPVGPGMVTLKFGSEGIGPGQFEDVRHVGTDANGNIYVAQYIGGRVQVFDPSGKYQTEWSVDRKMPLTGFAVSRQGAVYTTQQGKIEVHDGQTGSVIGELTYIEGSYFDSLWLMPNNTLITSWYAGSDDIVIFDPQGNVTTTITKAISTVTEDSELDTKVAADGTGNIYAAGSFNSAVFKFSPDGAFQDKFGGDGDGPGQFRAMLAIAVDGQGQVYVADIKGVQIFSPDGQYKGILDVDGAPYGLSVDDANHLWVAAGTQVFQYTLNNQ